MRNKKINNDIVFGKIKSLYPNSIIENETTLIINSQFKVIRDCGCSFFKLFQNNKHVDSIRLSEIEIKLRRWVK